MLPLVEAVGAGGDVVLVVEVLGQPHEGYAQSQRGVGAHAWSHPLVADQSRSVVEVGVDEDHLHAQVLEPLAPRCALVRTVHAPGGLRVGRPEHHQLRVLESVLEQVVLFGDAQARTEAPHVVATPLPAFPAVGVVLDVGHAPQVDEAVVGAEAVTDVAPHVVRGGRGHDGRRTHLSLEADHLLADDVQGFVPAYGFVAGLSPLVDVTVALGIEIHPLERSEDALGGIDGGLVPRRPGGEGRPARGCEVPAPGFDRPRRAVAGVEFQGDDAYDLAVSHIDVHGSARGQVGQASDVCHVPIVLR